MAIVYNYDFFQIPPTGLLHSGAVGNQTTRDWDNKFSGFGDLKFGARNASDYTLVANGFVGYQNPSVPEQQPNGSGNWSGAVNNPYVVGSTIMRIREDQLVIMLLGTRAVQPAKDVMDTKATRDTTISGTTVSGASVSNTPLYFPAEGSTFFGTRSGGPESYHNAVNV